MSHDDWVGMGRKDLTELADAQRKIIAYLERQLMAEVSENRRLRRALGEL